jgi:HSP20 family protein
LITSEYVKSPSHGGGVGSGGGSFTRPMISSEREPLADVISTDKEVKVIVEIPGANKQNINVNAYDNSVEVTTTDPSITYLSQMSIIV